MSRKTLVIQDHQTKHAKHTAMVISREVCLVYDENGPV